MLPSRGAAKLLFAVFMSLPSLFSHTAEAHHEAIFGPQSSLAFSGPGYLSSQLFSRNVGEPGDKVQETTGVLSGAYSPFSAIPLSFNVIQPFSYIRSVDRRTSQTGLEDTIVGARYRYNIESLQQRFDREGNFLIVTGGLELPTGSIDHDPFDGPLDAVVGVLGSVEKGALSAIAYGFYRYNGSRDGSKDGDNFILGTGAAWTPLDDAARGRLVSFQLGLSYESYARDQEVGARLDDTGGWGLLIHPTIVWGPSEDWLTFALVSIPLTQSYRHPAQEEHWRVGFGVTYFFQ